MIDKYLLALKVLARRLSDIEWYLIGKSSLALQGEIAEISHLTILIRYADLEDVLEELSGYDRSEVIELPNGECAEFKVKFEGVELLVCAEYPHGAWVNFLDKAIQIDSINCLPYEIEKKIIESVNH